MYQWVDWLTNPPLGEEVPTTNWIIEALTVTKKNNRRPDPGINSWGQLVKALQYRLRKRCNLKG